jgi:hypothetical protein
MDENSPIFQHIRIIAKMSPAPFYWGERKGIF